MSQISVIINTLNEEQNIADCITSVQSLADEIVVCDMRSEDRTVQIAQSLGARVVFHERAGVVEPARRFAISQAQHEWVLVLDADERMTETLAAKLRETAEEDTVDVVSFWSLFWYFDGWVRHGGFFSNVWTRFFRKQIYLDSYTPEEEYTHQNFSAVRNHKNHIRLTSEYHILHLAYPAIEKYITKTIGLYARLEAQDRRKQGIRFSRWKMVFQPARAFLVTFFYKQGFRDGIRGFILAVLYSVYQFAIWANLWLLEELENQPAPSKKGS